MLLRLGVDALVVKQRGEVVQTRGDVRVRGPELPLPNLERFAQHRFRAGVVSEAVIDATDRIEQPGADEWLSRQQRGPLTAALDQLTRGWLVAHGDRRVLGFEQTDQEVADTLGLDSARSARCRSPSARARSRSARCACQITAPTPAAPAAASRIAATTATRCRRTNLRRR